MLPFFRDEFDKLLLAACFCIAVGVAPVCTEAEWRAFTRTTAAGFSGAVIALCTGQGRKPQP